MILNKKKKQKKTYMDKLMSSFHKSKTPQHVQKQSLLSSTSTNTYDITKILNNKKSKYVAID
jgi:hypothetical protein